jgi:hypothetical protein
VLLVSSLLVAVGAAEVSTTRATMREIFDQLRTVLPLAVRDDGLATPENREQARKALTELRARAAQLKSHVHGFDPGARFIGSSLEHDALRALDLLDRGDADGAAYYVRHLTDSCVACHARLASPRSAAVTEGFVDQSDFVLLDPLERARLQIATRRFEEALTTLESAFESPALVPYELLAALTDYMIVCVRVLSDAPRAIPVLERFAQRPDLWVQLHDDVEAWIRYLAELDARPPVTDAVAGAQGLVEEARMLIVYPSDRRALVHYLFASRLLHAYVASHQEPSERLADAHYLLGVVESRIESGFWVSSAAFYLEAAIKMAPASPVARDAYALLEEETLAGYTGSGGLQLPAAVQAHLRDLRALMEMARREGS